MRTSRYLLATVKETPADAEIVSHQLMIRAGLIRLVAAGIYDWLPTGLRVLRKVENVVREEMDRAGAQEVLMPAVQPAELWKESGRWEDYGPELLRFQDRHGRDFCHGPTHEEVITALIKNEVRSYRQLPANWYQIQWKFRDEIRPRFGVMRGREFLMKDAYSFDIDRPGMEAAYRLMYEAYERIFPRLGLESRAVAADSGAIGGSYSHEFHVLADSGEDAIAICESCDFAANLETVDCPAPTGRATPAPTEAVRTVDTPGVGTIETLTAALSVAPDRTVKTLFVRGHDGPVALVVRGDHELNPIKADRLDPVASPVRFSTPEEVRAVTGADAGSLGPVGLPCPVFADHAAAVLADFVCGANEDGRHLTGVNWGRDLPAPETADLRRAEAGDACPRGADHGPLVVRRGIEVGHVFQLGTKYSEAMNATCLDENGRAAVFWMGCYGIGVSRIVAAAIEQNHDERGIVWPDPIAPFDVCIVPIGLNRSERVAQAARTLHDRLTDAGFEVLLDDRNERPGVMFSDMDLIGIPHRIVLGDRSLERGSVEYRRRSGTEDREIPLDDLVRTLTELRALGATL